MQKVKTVYYKGLANVQNTLFLAKKKLREKSGESHLVAILIMVAVVVVIGSYIFKRFTEISKNSTDRTASAIENIFNYTA